MTGIPRFKEGGVGVVGGEITWQRSQLQLIVAHLLPLRIKVRWMNVNSLKQKRGHSREALNPSNLLSPPLSWAIRSAGANNLHLPTDRATKGLPAGSQINPCVYVLELDCLVALPVVCVAHDLWYNWSFIPFLNHNHYLPHITGVPFSHLAKSRNLLLVGEWGGEVVAVQIPAIGEGGSGKKMEANLLVVRCSSRSFCPQATGSPLLHKSSNSGPWFNSLNTKRVFSTQTLRSQWELTSSFWVLPVTDCCPDPLPYFTSWLLWKDYEYVPTLIKSRGYQYNAFNYGISCVLPTYATWLCGSGSSASQHSHMSPATPSI